MAGSVVGCEQPQSTDSSSVPAVEEGQLHTSANGGSDAYGGGNCKITAADLGTFRAAMGSSSTDTSVDHNLYQLCDPAAHNKTVPCYNYGRATVGDGSNVSNAINWGSHTAIQWGVNIYALGYAIVEPLQIACIRFGVPLNAATAGHLIAMNAPGAGNSPPAGFDTSYCNPGTGSFGSLYCKAPADKAHGDIFGATQGDIASSGWEGWNGTTSWTGLTSWSSNFGWSGISSWSGTPGWTGETGWNGYLTWSGPTAWNGLTSWSGAVPW
jgi:hypothetical protein